MVTIAGGEMVAESHERRDSLTSIYNNTNPLI